MHSLRAKISDFETKMEESESTSRQPTNEGEDG